MSDTTTDAVQNSDPRIRDGVAAWQLISALRREDAPRSRSRMRVRGMIDGNPPYNPAKLRRSAQRDRTNLNFREADGISTARKSSYFDLVVEADPLVTLVPRVLPETLLNDEVAAQLVPPTILEFGDIIAREFGNVLSDWRGFLFHTMRHQSEMIDYGVGPVFFPDPTDWKFRAAGMSDILVPAGAPSNVDEQEVIVFSSEMSVVDLFSLIDSPEQTEVSRETGWNPTLIRKLISDRYAARYRDKQMSWEGIQEQIRANGLIEAAVGPKPAKIYYIMVREMSGSIAVFIVCSDSQERQFLFQSSGMYESFDQVINLFFYDIGDGTYHSVRGLGHRIFPHCEVNNRFMNSLVDGGILAASAVLNQTSSGNVEDLRRMKIGPTTVIPHGFEMSKNNFTPNLQGVASVRDVLKANLESNVGLFRHSGGGLGAKTAREVSVISRKEMELESTAISFYYSQVDTLYREVFRRLLDADSRLAEAAAKESRAFIDACLRRGVPKELLKPDVWKVRATRTSGAGSPVLRDLNSSQVLELAPMLDSRGKEMAVRNRLLALVGPDNVDKYQTLLPKSEIPVVNSSLARMESGLMRLGQPATAGDGEDHMAHVQIHLQGLEELRASTAQPGSWIQRTRSLGLIIEHTGQHLTLLAANPAYQQEVAEIKAVLDQYTNLYREWSGLAQQEQAQQEQALLNTEVEKERIRTDAVLRERLAKEENMARVREAKAQHQMNIQSTRFQQDLAERQQKQLEGNQ